jgi:hypothetical protein
MKKISKQASNGNISVSPTVKSINLTKGEADRARISAVTEKAAARQKAMADAEVAASMVEAAFSELKHIDKQRHSLFVSFASKAKDMIPDLLTMRHYFAHKPVDELFLGLYRIGDDWSRARLGVSFKYVNTLTNNSLPAEQNLLEQENGGPDKPGKPKPVKPQVRDDLQELLDALPTDADRAKFLKKFNEQEAALEAKNEEYTQLKLAKQEAEFAEARKKEEEKSEKIHRQELTSARQAAASNQELLDGISKSVQIRRNREAIYTQELLDLALNLATLAKDVTADEKACKAVRKLAKKFVDAYGKPPVFDSSLVLEETVTVAETMRASEAALKNEPSQVKQEAA